MRRKKNNATKIVHFESLPLIHPNAAGIDVGSKEHLVAVPLIEILSLYEPSRPLRQTSTSWQPG